MLMRTEPFTGTGGRVLGTTASHRPQLEVQLIETVRVRERYLKRLQDAVKGVNKLCRKKKVDRATRARIIVELQKRMFGIVVLIDELRLCTLEMIELIDMWTTAQVLAPGEEPAPFTWHRERYTTKMLHDMDFLENCGPIRTWFGFSLLENPLLVPPDEAIAEVIEEMYDRLSRGSATTIAARHYQEALPTDDETMLVVGGDPSYSVSREEERMRQTAKDGGSRALASIEDTPSSTPISGMMVRRLYKAKNILMREWAVANVTMSDGLDEVKSSSSPGKEEGQRPTVDTSGAKAHASPTPAQTTKRSASSTNDYDGRPDEGSSSSSSSSSQSKTVSFTSPAAAVASTDDPVVPTDSAVHGRIERARSASPTSPAVESATGSRASDSPTDLLDDMAALGPSGTTTSTGGGNESEHGSGSGSTTLPPPSRVRKGHRFANNIIGEDTREQEEVVWRKMGGELFAVTTAGTVGRMIAPTRETRANRIRNDLARVRRDVEYYEAQMADQVQVALSESLTASELHAGDSHDSENHDHGQEASCNDNTDAELLDEVLQYKREQLKLMEFEERQLLAVEKMETDRDKNLELEKARRALGGNHSVLPQDEQLSMSLEDVCATRIGKVGRGVITRRRVAELRQKQDELVRKIQVNFRQKKAGGVFLELGRQYRRVCLIQKVQRGYFLRKQVAVERAELLRIKSARLIQRLIRRFLGTVRFRVREEFVRSYRRSSKAVRVGVLLPKHVHEFAVHIEACLNNESLDLPPVEFLALLRCVLLLLNGKGPKEEVTHIAGMGSIETMALDGETMPWPGAAKLLHRQTRLLRRARALPSFHGFPSPRELYIDPDIEHFLGLYVDSPKWSEERTAKLGAGSVCITQMARWVKGIYRAYQLQPKFLIELRDPFPSWLRRLRREQRNRRAAHVHVSVCERAVDVLKDRLQQYKHEGLAFGVVLGMLDKAMVRLEEARAELASAEKSVARLNRVHTDGEDHQLFEAEQAKRAAQLGFTGAQAELADCKKRVEQGDEKSAAILESLKLHAEETTLLLRAAKSDQQMLIDKIERQRTLRRDAPLQDADVDEGIRVLGDISAELLFVDALREALIKRIGGMAYIPGLWGEDREEYEGMLARIEELKQEQLVQRARTEELVNIANDRIEATLRKEHDAIGINSFDYTTEEDREIDVMEDAEQAGEEAANRARYVKVQLKHLSASQERPSVLVLLSRMVNPMIREQLVREMCGLLGEENVAVFNQRENFGLHMQAVGAALAARKHTIAFVDTGLTLARRMGFIQTLAITLRAIESCPRTILLDASRSNRHGAWTSRGCGLSAEDLRESEDGMLATRLAQANVNAALFCHLVQRAASPPSSSDRRSESVTEKLGMQQPTSPEWINAADFPVPAWFERRLQTVVRDMYSNESVVGDEGYKARGLVFMAVLILLEHGQADVASLEKLRWSWKGGWRAFVRILHANPSAFIERLCDFDPWGVTEAVADFVRDRFLHNEDWPSLARVHFYSDPFLYLMTEWVEIVAFLVPEFIASGGGVPDLTSEAFPHILNRVYQVPDGEFNDQQYDESIGSLIGNVIADTLADCHVHTNQSPRPPKDDAPPYPLNYLDAVEAVSSLGVDDDDLRMGDGGGRGHGDESDSNDGEEATASDYALDVFYDFGEMFFQAKFADTRVTSFTKASRFAVNALLAPNTVESSEGRTILPPPMDVPAIFARVSDLVRMDPTAGPRHEVGVLRGNVFVRQRWRHLSGYEVGEAVFEASSGILNAQVQINVPGATLFNRTGPAGDNDPVVRFHLNSDWMKALLDCCDRELELSALETSDAATMAALIADRLSICPHNSLRATMQRRTLNPLPARWRPPASRPDYRVKLRLRRGPGRVLIRRALRYRDGYWVFWDGLRDGPMPAFTGPGQMRRMRQRRRNYEQRHRRRHRRPYEDDWEPSYCIVLSIYETNESTSGPALKVRLYDPRTCKEREFRTNLVERLLLEQDARAVREAQLAKLRKPEDLSGKEDAKAAVDAAPSGVSGEEGESTTRDTDSVLTESVLSSLASVLEEELHDSTSLLALQDAIKQQGAGKPTAVAFMESASDTKMKREAVLAHIMTRVRRIHLTGPRHPSVTDSILLENASLPAVGSTEDHDGTRVPGAHAAEAEPSTAATVNSALSLIDAQDDVLRRTTYGLEFHRGVLQRTFGNWHVSLAFSFKDYATLFYLYDTRSSQLVTVPVSLRDCSAVLDEEKGTSDDNGKPAPRKSVQQQMLEKQPRKSGMTKAEMRLIMQDENEGAQLLYIMLEALSTKLSMSVRPVAPVVAASPTASPGMRGDEEGPGSPAPSLTEVKSGKLYLVGKFTRKLLVRDLPVVDYPPPDPESPERGQEGQEKQENPLMLEGREERRGSSTNTKEADAPADGGLSCEQRGNRGSDGDGDGGDAAVQAEDAGETAQRHKKHKPRDPTKKYRPRPHGYMRKQPPWPVISHDVRADEVGYSYFFPGSDAVRTEWRLTLQRRAKARSDATPQREHATKSGARFVGHDLESATPAAAHEAKSLGGGSSEDSESASAAISPEHASVSPMLSTGQPQVEQEDSQTSSVVQFADTAAGSGIGSGSGSGEIGEFGEGIPGEEVDAEHSASAIGSLSVEDQQDMQDAVKPVSLCDKVSVESTSISIERSLLEEPEAEEPVLRGQLAEEEEQEQKQAVEAAEKKEEEKEKDAMGAAHLVQKVAEEHEEEEEEDDDLGAITGVGRGSSGRIRWRGMIKVKQSVLREGYRIALGVTKEKEEIHAREMEAFQAWEREHRKFIRFIHRKGVLEWNGDGPPPIPPELIADPDAPHLVDPIIEEEDEEGEGEGEGEGGGGGGGGEGGEKDGGEGVEAKQSEMPSTLMGAEVADAKGVSPTAPAQAPAEPVSEAKGSKSPEQEGSDEGSNTNEDDEAEEDIEYELAPPGTVVADDDDSADGTADAKAHGRGGTQSNKGNRGAGRDGAEEGEDEAAEGPRKKQVPPPPELSATTRFVEAVNKFVKKVKFRDVELPLLIREVITASLKYPIFQFFRLDVTTPSSRHSLGHTDIVDEDHMTQIAGPGGRKHFGKQDRTDLFNFIVKKRLTVSVGAFRPGHSSVDPTMFASLHKSNVLQRMLDFPFTVVLTFNMDADLVSRPTTADGREEGTDTAAGDDAEEEREKNDAEGDGVGVGALRS